MLISLKLTEDSYVELFGIGASCLDGTDYEIENEELPADFFVNFQSYKLVDNKLIFDEKKLDENTIKELLEELRQKREVECFPFVNRGELWYQNLTTEQYEELSEWYKKWLEVTDSLEIPDKPSWL